MRLYCFAHAGGTAAIYAPWARLLAPEIEVCAVELPGHGVRMDEKLAEDIHVLACDILPQLAEMQSDGRPFAFYGHSLGAAIAYETARALQETTLTIPGAVYDHLVSHAPTAPEHLFVGAARAPHLPPVLPRIGQLADKAFLTGVQQRYGGISEAVLAEPELLAMILPPMRADFAAYESYQHAAEPLLTCPITAFAGAFDPVVREDAVALWADHTSGSFRFHRIPGDHFFLTQHREQVLGIIQRALGHVTQRTVQDERHNVPGGNLVS